MRIPRILEAYRESIEAGLARALEGDAPLRPTLRYHVGLENEHGAAAQATGKLLRPSLVLFAAEQLGGRPEAALPGAVGLELIHSFSLIHDDIQDRDRVRRGRPAVWTIWGVEQAINAGDLMHTLAVSTAFDASPAAAACLVRATQAMIEGQCLDLEYEHRDVTAEDYLTMIDRKTGALFRCAFELGGIAAGVDDRALALLKKLGQALGRAFQIQDDVLGIWGDDDLLGKATGSDIRRRKKTLPVVLLLERAEGDDAAALATFYRRREPSMADLSGSDAAWVAERLNALGVKAACETMVRQHLAEAGDRLRGLPFSDDARASMDELIGFLARRNQ